MKTFKHKSNGSTMTYKDGCMKIENLVIEGEPNLDYWEEVVEKIPLLISEDGYDIFEGDGVFILNFEYKVVTYIPFCPNLPLLGNYRVFKNLDNLNKYISYTTAEGNIIREGQVFYIYNDVKSKCEETSYGHFKNEKYNGKRFKTKEEVEQIILMNKPCLSLNDLLSVWGTCNTEEMYALSPLFSNFKKLANEKIVGRI